MQHNRLMFFAVFADVRNVKALRQVHIHLNGSALPFAADGVAQNKFQLRTVERAFAFVDFIFVAVVFQSIGQGFLRNVPDFVGTDAVNAVRAR